jgi:integrator complex subunit 4
MSLLCKSNAGGLNVKSVVDILRKYTFDRDARVRAASLRSLISLHTTVEPIEVSFYQQAVNCLQDDFQQVREQAMDLMHALAITYPQHIVVHGNQSLTLVEDVFSKLCTMVRDVVVSVRTKACQLLGQLDNIPIDLLLETFGKIQMNYNPQYKYTAGNNRNKNQKNQKHQPQQQQQQQSMMEMENDEESEELPDGDIVVTSEEYTESDQLLYTGVVGTFVLGLEDQYQSVRIATIQSICAHSLRHKKFAHSALGHLINMFSDDIDAVRIEAIRTVTQLGAELVKLNEEQLQIILVLLEDNHITIRNQIHQLLSVVRLSNATCLHAAIRALLTLNMNKFPEDLNSIYKCLRRIGLNHALLVELLVEELLRLERYILTPENSVDDAYYTGIMIVIFNACEQNPNIPSHLPSYTYQHYSYLKNKYQHLFPVLRIRDMSFMDSGVTYTFNQAASTNIHGGSGELIPSLSSFLSSQTTTTTRSDNVIASIGESYQLVREFCQQQNYSQALRAISRIRLELSRMSTFSHDQSVEFLKLYTQCLEYYVMLLNDMKMTSTTLNPNDQQLLKLCTSITYLTYKMQTLYSLSPHIQHELKYWRWIVYLCAIITKKNNYASIQELRRRGNELLQNTTNISSSFVPPESIQQFILQHLPQYQYSNSVLNRTHVMSLIQREYFPILMLEHPNASPEDSNSVYRLSCRLTSPESNNIDKPVTFLSYIPLSIVVRGVVVNYTGDDSTLYIALRFPDGTFSVYPIQQSDMTRDPSTQSIEFRTELSIVMESWTHASSVHISLVRAYSTDFVQEYQQFYSIAGGNDDLWQVDLEGDTLLGDLRPNFIPIASDVRHIEYYIHPQDN